ncbi:DUF4114 domain-containing protein [Plectonema cf. radiosum LEGE 06105]|uniref:DUF4114 domain-containing protein n=1 Tax=Plectonema cf. radiosum LEGE 06105 TaxID=945769 RepID=A0A8J7K5L1_9CYAN|nr:DUF4114 domain-containing protein [Plectonema radiosum]MBE9215232.1 DUF4114 domain-containing protein [Plectonema cf. radiosum LEGE 06105]
MTQVSLSTFTDFASNSQAAVEDQSSELTIEVVGSNQLVLVFGSSSNDIIDASISSEGGNDIYGGSGDDTFILGSGDSVFGGAGDDKFFALSGGDNIMHGGPGVDQFWITTAEIPDSANIIADFALGEDVLGIAGLGIDFEDLSITQEKDNVLIAVNGSDLAILQGIGAANLSYQVNANNANYITVTIEDERPIVSFSVNTTTLNEEEGTLFTFNFSVNGAIPEGGLEIALGGELLPFIDQLDFSNFDFTNPDSVKGLSVGNFREDGAVLINITEPSASLSVRVFDDIVKEPDTSYDLTLLAGEGYQLNQQAKAVTVTVTDGVVIDNPPVVALSVDKTNLTEGEEFTVNFNVNADVSPDKPLTVLVKSTEIGALGELNLFNEDGTPAFTTTGIQGTPTVGDDTGSSFLVTLTNSNASIKLSTFNDGIGEGTETFNFALVEGERYAVDSSKGKVTFTIEESPVQVKFEANANGEVTKFAYDLGNARDNDVKASLDQEALDITDAAFDNLVGFYEVIDENGGIDVNGDGVADFNPGDAGYARAALENALDGIAIRLGGNPNNDTTAATFGDVIIQGGKSYAPFAIANAGNLSVQEFLRINPNNNAATVVDDQVAYFAFGAANPDGANHLKSWGNGIFGFEDLPANLGVSDNDFNDAVFKFNFTV